MIPLARAALPVLVVLALTAPAGADHCAGPSTSHPEVDVLGQYYVMEDCVAPDHCGEGPVYSIWIYEETNGMPGLQRGDEIIDDTCHEAIQADRIVF